MKRIEQYYMRIISKYFNSKDDYINLALVCKKFNVIDYYTYNPIDDISIFKNMKHLHIYKNDSSENLSINKIDKIVDWRPIKYSDIKYKFIDYKHIILDELIYPIPSNVREIGEDCFRNAGIGDIIIPDSITKLGVESFYRCNNVKLNNILREIPRRCFQYAHFSYIDLKNVIRIDTNGFDGSWIKEIDLSKIQKLGGSAFCSCFKLTSITFSDSIEKIKSWTFAACINLNNVDLSKCTKLKELGKYCFESCRQISSVKLPLTITRLKESCFEKCYNLQEINLENLKWLGERSFCKCTKLKELYLNVYQVPYRCFDECFSLEQVNFTSRLNELSSNAFRDCSNLTSISILNNCNQNINKRISICRECFHGCIKLTNMLNNIKYLGHDSYYECKLNEIDLTNIPIIWNNVFYKCTNLTRIILSTKIKSLNEECFDNCSNLSEIKIPSNITRIHDSCFYNCRNLREIDLSYVRKLGESVFYNCKNLTNIILSDTIKELKTGTFAGCINLTKIDLKNIKILGHSCFWRCSKLKEINLDNVKYISHCCFCDCSSLETIKLNESIKKISVECFENCVNLKSINLENIQEFGDYCFHRCKYLDVDFIKNDKNDN